MLDNEKTGLYIYNFFPLLYGDLKSWPAHLIDIKDMGFNTLYINPIYQSGFSGSLYAPKDYFAIDKRFGREMSPEKNVQDLRTFIDKAHSYGMKVILDLVINHTSIDCPLVKEKPEWYLKKDGHIVHPGAYDGIKWIEWGDLARINNDFSNDEKNLYEYWLGVSLHYLDLGFDGFRADAAYQVPKKLWKYLIGNCRLKYPEAFFLGETLGCEIDDTIDIADAGFSAVMNSSKYWNYSDDWLFSDFYQQLCYLKGLHTVAFPESHDTPRLITELKGNIPELLARLQFVAFWSAGLMIPTGFEYGFRKEINVVKSSENNYENNTGIDFTGFLKRLLEAKKKYRILSEDSYIERINTGNVSVLGLLKISRNREERVLFIMNKNRFGSEHLHIHNIFDVFKLTGCPVDISIDSPMNSVPKEFDYNLRASEVRMIYLEGKAGILKKLNRR